MRCYQTWLHNCCCVSSCHVSRFKQSTWYERAASICFTSSASNRLTRRDRNPVRPITRQTGCLFPELLQNRVKACPICSQTCQNIGRNSPRTVRQRGKKVKVKESHYRPGQAQKFSGGWDQISRQSAHEGGKVVSPTHRPPLPPGNIPGTHFC